MMIALCIKEGRDVISKQGVSLGVFIDDRLSGVPFPTIPFEAATSAPMPFYVAFVSGKDEALS
jgi:hypothetical protein